MQAPQLPSAVAQQLSRPEKRCDGVKNGTCVFTIGQNICVQVPVEFGATAQVGDTYVNCNGATADDICTDCNQPALPDMTVEDNAVKDTVTTL